MFTTESPFDMLTVLSKRKCVEGQRTQRFEIGRREEAEGRSLISSEEIRAFNAGGRGEGYSALIAENRRVRLGVWGFSILPLPWPR